MPCIVLVGGVPGTGKSTLIKFILKHEKDLYHFNADVNEDKVTNNADSVPSIHKIVFDEICSVEDQAEIIKKVNGWRQFRIQLLEAAERYMCAVSGFECHFQGPLTACSQEILEKLMKCNRSSLNTNQNGHGRDENAIFLVEDNFYYSSMRYEWFQVARRDGMSFCQIMLKCPLEVACQRNKERNQVIPEFKIKLMFSQIEYPDVQKNRWEKFSMVFDNSETLNCTSVCPLITLVKEAMAQPAEIVLNEEKLEAQVICSKSVLHQADRILRKLTGELIQELKEQTGGKVQEDMVQDVIKARQVVYQELKQGVLQLPSDITDNIQCSGIHFSENYDKLEKILRELYKQKYCFPFR